MYNPSGVKPAANVVIKEGSTYSFKDAYSGEYEFFDNRPIPRVEQEPATIVVPKDPAPASAVPARKG